MVMELRLRGDVLRRLRGDLSQGALATKAGVSRATVNRIEMGHAESVTIDTINALARALDVDANTLVTFDHPPGKARR